ncbi:MAG TPA: hypothetical protein VLA88_00280 [Candidatus Saccharimonadales bacterium]|nr:hypothetical protein [Candidatus Saccharimonadales bacterium]
MKKSAIIMRASVVLGALSVLVGGVTYAAITSSATLTGNTLASVTGSLLVDGPDAGSVPTASEAGLQFTGLVPGAAAYSAAQTFSLKNDGTGNLKIAVTADGGVSAGTYDPSKVHVKITNTTVAGNPSVEATLDNFATLFNNLPGVSGADKLLAGATNSFDVQVKADADAVTGSSASFSNFNLTFTGTAVE